jgi:acyl carrier protein
VPLSKLKKPADDLDVVEIVMTVEETFNVVISDEEVGASLDEVTKTLSIKKLADIVARKSP